MSDHPLELRGRLLQKIKEYKDSRFPDHPPKTYEKGGTSGSDNDSQERDIEIDSSQPVSQIIDDSQPPSDAIIFPDSQSADTAAPDSDEDDVVFLDIPIDTRSIRPHAPPIIPDLPLEVIQVQVISTHEGMISALERFEGNFRMMMTVIRDSTNDYTPRQLELIDEIEAEYSIYHSTNSRDPQHLQNRIHAFAENLAAQLLQESSSAEPAPDELQFFESQKRIYNRIYEALIRSAFPFSHQQMEFVHSIRYHLDYATGNPRDEIDMQIMSDLRGLLDSLADNNHVDDTTPHRFYIDCTIEHHAHVIIQKLEPITDTEGDRDIPLSIPAGSTVHIATFVVNRLLEIFGLAPSEPTRELFHDGLREVYFRLLNIFQNSNLTFTDHQKQLLQGIQESISSPIRGPAEHEDIHLRFFGFMDSLRQERPKREVITPNGIPRYDPDGIITKAVDGITWDLLFLQNVAEKHFDSFPLHVERIPNISQIITRHFLKFYTRFPLSHTIAAGNPSTH